MSTTRERLTRRRGSLAPALRAERRSGVEPSGVTGLPGADPGCPAAVPGRSRWSVVLFATVVTVVFDAVAVLSAALASDVRPLRAFLAVVVLVLWLAVVGSYRRRVTRSIQTDVVPLLAALAVPTFVLLALHQTAAGRLAQTVPWAAALLVVSRAASYQVQCSAARRFGGDRTLIVGAGVLGCVVARALLEHPEYGMSPVGFVDGFPDDGLLPLPLLGDIDTFDDVVRRSGATRVIVAFGANREAEIVGVLRASAEAHLEVHTIPRLYELGVTPIGQQSDLIWGLPLQHARRAALRTPAWRTKRACDVVLSALGLALASPLLAVAAVAVKVTSRGPVIFRQMRVGQRGEVVQIFKFRSMKVNCEADTRWGGHSDERVTAVGRLLRATSIDELPQILNVLRGDMSLVGPRPERPHFAERFDRDVLGYRERLRVPVGLTGWAQVHGLRGDTSIEERARFDNYYIEHWSLWFDAVILTRTVGQVLKVMTTALRPALRRGR